MNAVIILDISDSTQMQNLRQAFRSNGYYLTWFTPDTSSQNNSKREVYLPHNIIWRPDIELQQAIDDVNRIISQYNVNNPRPITLLRCVVLNSTPWKAIWGNPV